MRHAPETVVENSAQSPSWSAMRRIPASVSSRGSWGTDKLIANAVLTRSLRGPVETKWCGELTRGQIGVDDRHMRSLTPNYSENTLGYLLERTWGLQLTCATCNHRASWFRVRLQAFDPRVTVGQIAERARCRCGSRNGGVLVVDDRTARDATALAKYKAKTCHERSEAWLAESARIRADADRKRTEAAKEEKVAG